jgi:predicted O-methyltransferase YrrM
MSVPSWRPDLAAKLRAATTAASRGRMSSSERHRISEIEALRGRLMQSTVSIDIVDYGAGDPSATRSPEEMDRGRLVTLPVSRACAASVQPLMALFLFRLIREFKPDRCLELGTNLGISSAYQAAALEANGRGHLITLEGADSLAELARENLRSLSLAPRVDVVTGQFDATLETTLTTAGRSEIEYAFIDGRHDEQATLEYFHEIKSHVAPAGGLLVFDDVDWSDGMRRAWTAICDDASVAGASVAGFGIAFVG